jgi:hypothetical protein
MVMELDHANLAEQTEGRAADCGGWQLCLSEKSY